MIGYNVAVFAGAGQRACASILEKRVGGVHFNVTPRPVCVELLRNKFSPLVKL